MFAEKGYHDARVDDFVARVGVARGTFYLYFDDKRALFEALVARFMLRLTDAIEPIELSDPGVDPIAALRANLLRVVVAFVETPAMAKILLSTAVGVDPDFDRRLLSFYEEITALIVRSLSQAEAAGLVRPGHAQIRSFCLVGLLKETLYQLVLRGATFPPEALVDTMLDLVSRGIFVRPGDASATIVAAP